MTAPMANPAMRRVGPKRMLLRFDRLPGSYIHPERLSGCLPPGLPRTYLDRLMGMGRLKGRLSTVIERRFNLTPCTADDVETPAGRFARLEGRDLGAVVQRIGAIWHARSIAAVILAEPLKVLIDWLGRDGYRAALAHIELAQAEADKEIVGDKPDIDRLCLTIMQDGERCISAWCQKQPASLGRRLALKLPPEADLDERWPEGFREKGAAIADRVMKDMVERHGDGIG